MIDKLDNTDQNPEETPSISNDSFNQIFIEQKLLFDGFMRMEILNDLNTDNDQPIPIDVINLCFQFYKPDICLQYKEDDDILDSSSDDIMSLCKTYDHFLAFKIAEVLTSHYPDTATSHST